MITPLAVICALVALCLFTMAVIIFRNTRRLLDELTSTMLDQGLHPCPHRPLDAIPCARHAGHKGPHLIRPSDIIHSGYYPTPF